MEKMELIAPCHFGMEAVLKREVLDLGYEISTVEDGRVCFWGDAQAICDANVFLRTAERILLKVGSFKAETFDELFEKTRVLPWENYIPKNGKFWVTKAASVKSKLFSPSDIQSIMKKAMVERLRRIYGIEWFQEDGPAYPIRVFLMKDIVTIGIDTSGVSLHKRLSSDDRKGTDHRDTGIRTDHADTVAQGPDPGRPFLRKWNISNRSGFDGS